MFDQTKHYQKNYVYLESLILTFTRPRTNYLSTLARASYNSLLNSQCINFNRKERCNDEN